MLYRILADMVVAAHLAFVAFVASGGLLVCRSRRWAWIHAPAFLWGALVEIAGWVCPLTPLENHLRDLGGESGYAGDFAGRWLLPALYPEGLTRQAQIGLGVLALAINLALYARAFRRRRPAE